MILKTYVIILSRIFPKGHKRAGEPTGFKEKLRKEKLYSIRANYQYWEKIFEEIYAGDAGLSVRQWSGLPSRSKQVELMRLTREDGIGLQKLEHIGPLGLPFVGPNVILSNAIAQNDGLSYEDWKDWFKNYDTSKPMAIIHFTGFRY